MTNFLKSILNYNTVLNLMMVYSVSVAFTAFRKSEMILAMLIIITTLILSLLKGLHKQSEILNRLDDKFLDRSES